MRKKIFTFLLALAASVGMMNAKVTWNSSNMSSFSISDTDQPYTLEGVTLRTNASLAMAYCDGNGDEIHFVSYDPDGFTFSNTLGKNFTKIEMFLTSSGEWGNANLGSGWSFMNNGPVTWTGNASTVDLLKGEDDFGGASVKIVFYFEGDSQEPDPTPAQPSWVSDGDTWDESTKTLTVNSNPGVAAYAENFDIQHLVISNSVTSIGDLAFGVCTGITSIDIPSSVTSIGNSAFSNCINATSLTIPNSVVSIGVGAFSSCNKLTSVAIPNSVTSIGTSTFNGCSGLTSVTIPNSVTSIGVDAFRGCTGITSIEIPNSVISIGDRAFKDCSGLTSMTIPNSVTNIGEEAFQECTGMTSVTIPNSITSIEKGVFQYCGLTSVTIPSTVTTIGVSAFAGCQALTSVTIPNGVTTIKGSAFQYCTGLTSVTISSSVTSIEELAFLWSGNIAEVYCYPNAASLTWVCDQSEFKENKATYCHVPVSQWAAYEQKFSDVNVTFIGDLPDPTPDPDEVAADAVEDLINAIPNPVAYNDECKNAIDAAREAYDALTDAQKALVGNYSTLTDAEAAYDALIPTPVDPQPAGPIPCTAADLGKVLCTDGSIYATVSEASAASKTAAAVIAYVDTENGKALALALANESGTMDWETAKTTAAAHTPAVSGGTWTLASKDDWDHMINAAGGYNALRDGFSGVGGTNIQKCQYWTSTEYDSGTSLVLTFGTNDGGYFVALYEDPYNVRACLAFDISAAPQPAEDVDITPNVDPQQANVYYSTFFDSSVKYELPAGVEAYVADLSGANLLLTKIAEAGEVIPANVAVILKSTVTPFTLTVSDAEAVTFTANNDLLGVDAITALTSIDGLTATNCYVLSGTNEYGVGFYRINSENLKAHKAYVRYEGNQNNAPKRMRFVFNQEQTATGIEDVQGSVQTTKVLENGVLYIIKNGVRYNVQGQIVK